MKKPVIILSLILFIIISISSGTIASYTKTLEPVQGTVTANKFIIDSTTQTKKPLVSIAPGESGEWDFEVANFTGNSTNEVNMNMEIRVDLTADMPINGLKVGLEDDNGLIGQYIVKRGYIVVDFTKAFIANVQHLYEFKLYFIWENGLAGDSADMQDAVNDSTSHISVSVTGTQSLSSDSTYSVKVADYYSEGVTKPTDNGNTDNKLPANFALYSKNNVDFQGSSHVNGDAIIESGTLGGSNNPWAYNGSIYKTNNVTVTDNFPVNASIIKDYTGKLYSFSMPVYKAIPDTSFFNGKGNFTDGTKDLVVGWSGNQYPDNYTLTTDAYINKLEVSDTLNLNISVNAGAIRIIRVNELNNRGYINITGGGEAIIYIDKLDSASKGNYNTGGTSDKLTLFVSGTQKNVTFDNMQINANIFVPYSDLNFSNITMNGSVYTGGNLSMTNSVTITGYVFVPSSNTSMRGSSNIIGQLITNGADMAGSSYVMAGNITPIPNDINQFIQGS